MRINDVLNYLCFTLKIERRSQMSDTIQIEEEFTIESIPEPENIEEIIFSLMVNPNLSTINYFNDFSEISISPDEIENGDTDEIGIFDIDNGGAKMAMSTHAFHHHLESDPQKATEILIARAARRMLCFGAVPTVISAFLYHINIADPNGQFIASGAKKGMENAAQKFNLKISDKKIRFDHFSKHGPASPTIIISMMGKMESEANLTTYSFKRKGNHIFMIGKMTDDISSSEYLEFYHGISESPLPAFNIEDEIELQNCVKQLNAQGLIESASPIGKGGLFFTLLRAATPNELGFDITTSAETRIDSFLFGEAMGRILVGVCPEKEDEFVDAMTEMKIPFFTLGHVTKGEIRIDDESFGFIDKMTAGV